MHRFAAVSLALALTGCMAEDIPQAHKGRLFDKTGLLIGYVGGKGFTGPILGPGTYWTGLYDRLRLLDCSVNTKKEDLTALTKDGVQFGLDVYVRFTPDCSEGAASRMLDTLVPADGHTISADQIYGTYVRPALGEAVREVVSPYGANDLNNDREKVLVGIRERFLALITAQKEPVVSVEQINLSNMDFPEEMDAANNERAVQSVWRDKAIAERERVQAEIETAERRKELAQKEGEVEAARIDQIGAAISRNPGYLQYQMQLNMPSIYEKAGVQGNMVITAPDPNFVLKGK